MILPMLKTGQVLQPDKGIKSLYALQRIHANASIPLHTLYDLIIRVSSLLLMLRVFLYNPSLIRKPFQI